MFVAMQFVEHCDSLGVRCNLSWRPSDANEEADRITEYDVSDFCKDRQLHVRWSEIDLSVVRPLLAFSGFRSTLQELRSDSGEQPSSAKVRFEKSHWG